MPEENPTTASDPHGLLAKEGYGYEGRCVGCGARFAATLNLPNDRESTASFLGEMMMSGYRVSRVPHSELTLEPCRCPEAQPKVGGSESQPSQDNLDLCGTLLMVRIPPAPYEKPMGSCWLKKGHDGDCDFNGPPVRSTTTSTQWPAPRRRQ